MHILITSAASFIDFFLAQASLARRNEITISMIIMTQR